MDGGMDATKTWQKKEQIVGYSKILGENMC